MAKKYQRINVTSRLKFIAGMSTAFCKANLNTLDDHHANKMRTVKALLDDIIRSVDSKWIPTDGRKNVPRPGIIRTKKLMEMGITDLDMEEIVRRLVADGKMKKDGSFARGVTTRDKRLLPISYARNIISQAPRSAFRGLQMYGKKHVPIKD